ncbi:bifunctional 2-polyprenyl-6-hydroxyphenol methylase/3-demethylubiquinol 3-O-methyltransferase UbiG [Desulfovibrio sp. JC010]|uniref:class I SAM-dependent methyltransferase n=1 Tax=Desulfovibrio sp. JC010 TaxID=2593641 RepID=UPI0013D3EA62|nr:class I SAM-dependent methyltransferase [Desulfovibrio sp. JC010]NDV25106.1 class I SAM-dependent methyltransferase [Desulfovibrio sp. JC010]
MPLSETEGKDWIFKRFYTLAQMKTINSVLDIGPGCGTYSDLLREHAPDVYWTGVEIWGPYIKEYNLEQKYDQIIVADLRYLDYSKIKHPDCIIAGDVLEHISEDEMREILLELLRITKVIFVSIPIVHMPQDEWGGNPFEKHVEDSYTHERLMEILPSVCDFRQGNRIGTYILSRDVQTRNILKQLNKTQQ